MKDNIGPGVRIKAAGGIRTVDSAREMIDNGAVRIGPARCLIWYPPTDLLMIGPE